ncbi:MAG: hypothetical protein NW241_15795, partial [Bacteroidia bacterium]|nr:hypothetical protein [Bacteroidia bacterium]
MSGLYENTYRIDSARLASWDYARSGIYFVTICTQNRAHFFGEMIAMPMPGGGAMHRMPGIRRDAMHRVS